MVEGDSGIPTWKFTQYVTTQVLPKATQPMLSKGAPKAV